MRAAIMVDLVSAVETSIRSNSSSVEGAVFGSQDAGTIVTWMTAHCAAVLDSTIDKCLFYKATVGVVVGLQLANGTQCVLKAYQPRWSRVLLEAAHRVQGHLANGGFPCPVPLTGPHPLGLGWATVDHLCPDPGQGPLSPEMMAVSAHGLAEQINRCKELNESGFADHPFQAAPGELYSEPHSPMFDFRSTAAGAEWIDELAVAAVKARNTDSSAPVVAHTDWSVRNVRLGDSEVLAVYDWDSLAMVTESQAVGQAAVAWAAFDEMSDPIAPTTHEVAEYIRHYEAARGVPLSPVQRRAAGAAALWLVAYTARCEHAANSPSQWARARLESDGRLFLNLHEAF